MNLLRSYLNPLELKENRERIAHLLRNRGFYIRLHAYDYLVMAHGKIVCTIHLLSHLNECYINISPIVENSEHYVNKIVKVIKSIAPTVKVYLRKSMEYSREL